MELFHFEGACEMQICQGYICVLFAVPGDHFCHDNDVGDDIDCWSLSKRKPGFERGHRRIYHRGLHPSNGRFHFHWDLAGLYKKLHRCLRTRALSSTHEWQTIARRTGRPLAQKGSEEEWQRRTPFVNVVSCVVLANSGVVDFGSRELDRMMWRWSFSTCSELCAIFRCWLWWNCHLVVGDHLAWNTTPKGQRERGPSQELVSFLQLQTIIWRKRFASSLPGVFARPLQTHLLSHLAAVFVAAPLLSAGLAVVDCRLQNSCWVTKEQKDRDADKIARLPEETLAESRAESWHHN